jgi:dihydrofolate reductase
VIEDAKEVARPCLCELLVADPGAGKGLADGESLDQERGGFGGIRNLPGLPGRRELVCGVTSPLAELRVLLDQRVFLVLWPRRPRLSCGDAVCDDRGAMLIYSMSVSLDGFITDREGAFEWSFPTEEQFRFHLSQICELGGLLLGRKLYETMLPWETDPSMRETELEAAFADVWSAIPKVVFSRTLDGVEGNARLAEGSVAEEAAATLAATEKDVEIGGANIAAEAIALGLVDELRIFRNPVVVGGGTPFLPAVTEKVPLDLVETRTFGSRVIYERYRRAHAESD